MHQTNDKPGTLAPYTPDESLCPHHLPKATGCKDCRIAELEAERDDYGDDAAQLKAHLQVAREKIDRQAEQISKLQAQLAEARAGEEL